jgi:WD40 repeat protein
VSGQQLAVAYDDGQIPVFNALTGKISSPLYTGRRPNVMGFSPNGAWLVVGSESGSVSIWNLANANEKLPSFLHRGGVLALAFSSKDNKLATAGNDNTSMIGLSIKKEIFRIGNQTLIRDLAFSPDGSRLVTASADRRIRIWDALNGVERLAMAQDGSVTEVVFSSDGRWLATTGDDRTARVWDAETGEEIFQIPLKASGTLLAFCNDNKWLITTDESGAIEIWDISIMMVPDLSCPPHRRASWTRCNIVLRMWLAVSVRTVSGAYIGSGSVLKRETAQAELSFSRIYKLVFSPDSARLGILTEGNELAIHNVERNALDILPISGIVQAIAFSPDSQQLITRRRRWQYSGMGCSGCAVDREPCTGRGSGIFTGDQFTIPGNGFNGSNPYYRQRQQRRNPSHWRTRRKWTSGF